MGPAPDSVPGLIVASNAPVGNQPAALKVGGLLLQPADEADAPTDSGGGSSSDASQRRRSVGQSQTTVATTGRDAAGFMNVFVVRGGVNTNFSQTGGR